MSKLEDVILRDITGNRPAAGVAGRLFFDTTLVKMQRDTGAAWEDVAEVGGGGGGVETFAVCDGRLTLESGVPVSISDQSAKTTLNFTPYKGEQVGLNDGAGGWDIITFAEINITMVGLTASRVYDVFCWNNGGTATLEVLIWTDATTRATNLTREDGILVKVGDYTRRYLGTIYINSTGGQTEDTLIARFVWNYYNRVRRQFYFIDSTVHTYATATWRSWNANNALRIEVMVGVSEEPLALGLQSQTEAANYGEKPAIALGLDSTSSPLPSFYTLTHGIDVRVTRMLYVNDFPTTGYHYYQAIEKGDTNADTFAGVVVTGYING